MDFTTTWKITKAAQSTHVGEILGVYGYATREDAAETWNESCGEWEGKS